MWAEYQQPRVAFGANPGAFVGGRRRARARERRPAADSNVAILLCTWHGQRYLREQLDSIAEQTHGRWKLWVSDDESTDGTLPLVAEFRDSGSHDDRVSVRPGPCKGFAANFLSLVCTADVQANYYAYADQDDIWCEDKLQRALSWLSKVPRDVPALYCSRTELVNAEGRTIGLSPLFSRTPGFANALVQNIAGGNTMVFNQAARRLLQAAGPHVQVVAHDWWAYLVVTGCGGRVFYDPSPTVRYRQHDANLIGRNTGVAARIARMRMLLQGRFRDWQEVNLHALESIRSLLTPENHAILETFRSARCRPGAIGRVRGVWRSGVYRQTLLGNVSLTAAAALNRI